MPSGVPGTVFAAVLCAALLHAGWNAVVKGAVDARHATNLVVGSAAVFAALALLFVPSPPRSTWPYLAGSAVTHLTYFALVVRAYRSADMGVTYPLMRGAAPFIVALSGAMLGERLSAGAWAGVALISLGIMTLVAGKWRGNLDGMLIALINGAVIACYTLIDGHGVRIAGEALGYTLWVFLLSGILYCATIGRSMITPALRLGGRSVALGALGGAATIAAYAIVLWAMTRAQVAAVAALRETSILFAVVIAALVLGERPTLAQSAGAAVIAIGAVVLKLA